MDTRSAVQALVALGSNHRLQIFRTLVRAGPNGMRAGEIAEHLGLGATSLSFHLKELDRAGLLVAARHGRNIVYAVHIDGVRALLTFLTEDCCQGRPELCGETFAAAHVCETDDSTPAREDQDE